MIEELTRGLGVPITVFVAGVILERKPAAVDILGRLPSVEFGVHGHTHDLRLASRVDDAERGIKAYRAFFGFDPGGYRAPQGRICAPVLRLLRDEGVTYDSSIFPTFRPGAFNNLHLPNRPFIHSDVGLLELPITALRPLPIPLGLGYLRMLGLSAAAVALRAARLPESVVAAFHLHDVVPTSHMDTLGPAHRWLYQRNVKVGAELLERAVNFLKGRGYRFSLMAEVAARARAAGIDAAA